MPLGVDPGVETRAHRDGDISFFVTGGELKPRTRHRCWLQTDLVISVLTVLQLLKEI